jgi:hypothetical protein
MMAAADVTRANKKAKLEEEEKERNKWTPEEAIWGKDVVAASNDSSMQAVQDSMTK